MLDASILLGAIIAHAGDGNFHTLILFVPTDEEQCKEAKRLNNLRFMLLYQWKAK